MDKVIVLLSTYNGEKYVAEQIESILKQTYENIEIYARDDGSSDATKEILMSYKQQKKIHFYAGDNKGFIGSFFELITQSVDATYYAFCDQDDIWKSDKIARAVELLSKTNAKKPALYFSDYDYYDQDMKFVGRCASHKRGPSFRNSLVDCISLGISSVFNKKACDMMKEQVPKHCCGHDWWVYMLCAGLGEVIYDKTPTVQYRRHSSNVSPGGMGFIKFQIWRIKKFLLNDYFKNVREQLHEFANLYDDKLSAKDRKDLALFTGEHRVRNALKKFFALELYRQGLADEIMLRIIFVLGKL